MKIIEYDKLMELIDLFGYWIADNGVELSGDVILDLIGQLLPYITKEVSDEQ